MNDDLTARAEDNAESLERIADGLAMRGEASAAKAYADFAATLRKLVEEVQRLNEKADLWQSMAEKSAAEHRTLAEERKRWLKLLGPCPKRRIHERYKDSTHPELIAAARMCTPENPCERCRALPAPEAT